MPRRTQQQHKQQQQQEWGPRVQEWKDSKPEWAAYTRAAQELARGVQAVPKDLCAEHACSCHLNEDSVHQLRFYAHKLLQDPEPFLLPLDSTQQQHSQHELRHAQVQMGELLGVSVHLLAHSVTLLRAGHSPDVMSQMGRVLNE
jgi:hypothetical protein